MSNSGKNIQSNLDGLLFGLSLDPQAGPALHLQLTDALRDAILTGRAGARARLPASRRLAEELSVSRMTVTTAYDQLASEGYLTTTQGAGTFVAQHLPHLSNPPRRRVPVPDPPQPWQPFEIGLADPMLFPHRTWARCLERAWRRPDPALLARPDPFGWPPLRRAICDHLSAWRRLECSPEQIVITSGARDALALLCQVGFARSATIAIEDPGWLPMHRTLKREGARPHPIRIDQEGLNPAALPPGATGAIVTPARHYPTGAAMPLARRLALLDWARQNGALIVEDDYDSEFRYQGQPLPSLCGLDGVRNTIYLGSFSKLLSAALRLGYLVLPEAIVPKARAALSGSGARASLVAQPALAEFMGSGDFATHLRRMRRTYARRQAVLLTALEGAAKWLKVAPDPSGMHLCCPLRPGLRRRGSDRAIVARARDNGLNLLALSDHCNLPDPPQALLMGYAGFDEAALREAGHRLCGLLESL